VVSPVVAAVLGAVVAALVGVGFATNGMRRGSIATATAGVVAVGAAGGDGLGEASSATGLGWVAAGLFVSDSLAAGATPVWLDTSVANACRALLLATTTTSLAPAFEGAGAVPDGAAVVLVAASWSPVVVVVDVKESDARVALMVAAASGAGEMLAVAEEVAAAELVAAGEVATLGLFTGVALEEGVALDEGAESGAGATLAVAGKVPVAGSVIAGGVGRLAPFGVEAPEAAVALDGDADSGAGEMLAVAGESAAAVSVVAASAAKRWPF
jgi:hypothetical protein